jgi:hypothetical protein
VQVFWSEWCPPGTPPGGSIGRRPDAIVLTLPHGRGELRLRPARAPRCDLPSARSTLSVGPFAPRQREPSPTTQLPLRATIVGVPLPESKLKPPTLRARRGGLLRYEIVVTNVSRRTVDFERCPAYLEQLAPQGRALVYVLNCRPAGAIGPGAHATFAMVLRVPRTAPRGANGLFWELGPTTYLPPTAAARVLVA